MGMLDNRGKAQDCGREEKKGNGSSTEGREGTKRGKKEWEAKE